jgi:nitrile hydratase accessory protein
VSGVDPAVASADGPAAPPRSNGELVFSEPWESRAFGVAVALHDARVVDFEAFRERLIDEIGAGQASHGSADASYRYYEHWLTALERTLLAERVVDPDDLQVARAAIEREWDHDHDHDHGDNG